MASTAVCSEVVVLLLLIHCFLFFPIFGPCFVVPYLVSFLIVLQSSRWGRANFVFLVSCGCYVLFLFLTVPWVGLQCVIVAFPAHTHLMFKAQFRLPFLGLCDSNESLSSM